MKPRRGGQRRIAIFAFLVGAHAAVACNGASLRSDEPCRGAGCSCEQDPNQPLCRGFNERPEASPGFDAGIVEASDDALEAGADASVDDAADANDDADGS